MYITISILTAGVIAAIAIMGWIANAVAEFLSDVFDVFMTGLKATLIFGTAITIAVCVYHFI